MTDSTLVVDPIACDGHGLCAELLPEWIRPDDWGYPIIAPGPVPLALASSARQAIRLCPKLALTLQPLVPRDQEGPRASLPDRRRVNELP